MKSIWKFPLRMDEQQIITMPKEASILSLQIQNEILCMWVLVETENEKEERRFIIHGTGHECTCDVSEFIGTFQIPQQGEVFHVFEEIL